MKEAKIKDETGFYKIFIHDAVELVNPIDYYKRYWLESRAKLLAELAFIKDPELARQNSADVYIEAAGILGRELFAKYESMDLNPKLRQLLESTKKSEQLRILKDVSITVDDLVALAFIAFREYGFLYSTYRFEKMPKGFENRVLPQVFHLRDDGTMHIIGQTDCSEGELRTILDHRKVIVPKLFVKDKVWHCFLTTYSSLSGKESWENGTPHYHYISSAFNLSKEELIEGMKTGTYKSSPIHIGLTDYGL